MNNDTKEILAFFALCITIMIVYSMFIKEHVVTVESNGKIYFTSTTTLIIHINAVEFGFTEIEYGIPNVGDSVFIHYRSGTRFTHGDWELGKEWLKENLPGKVIAVN